jgi:hypothetical protein
MPRTECSQQVLPTTSLSKSLSLSVFLTNTFLLHHSYTRGARRTTRGTSRRAMPRTTPRLASCRRCASARRPTTRRFLLRWWRNAGVRVLLKGSQPRRRKRSSTRSLKRLRKRRLKRLLNRREPNRCSRSPCNAVNPRSRTRVFVPNRVVFGVIKRVTPSVAAGHHGERNGRRGERGETRVVRRFRDAKQRVRANVPHRGARYLRRHYRFLTGVLREHRVRQVLRR